MDFELFAAAAAADRPPVLVTVLATRGSSPRHAGSKMLVREGQPLLGSVGGGRLEAAALEAARDCARSGFSRLIEAEMLGESALGEEMICGGSSLMLVESLDPAACAAARGILEAGRRVLVARRFGVAAVAREAAASGGTTAAGGPPCPVELAILDEELAPAFGVLPPWLEGSTAGEVLAAGRARLSADGRSFLDPLMPRESLVILGGGHVGQALARHAAGLDFAVTVVDDRPAMADPARFPPGTAVLASGYVEAVAALPFDASTYVVILTRGHAFDLEAARAVLRQPRRYAGMIGSARKVRLILERLEAEGMDRDLVASLCSPVGVDIGAETPDEIAVAILAEMIAYRRKAPILGELAASRAARRT